MTLRSIPTTKRSGAAAKEITLLVGDSVEKVAAGSTLVGEAGQTMDLVVTSVKQVADIMGNISSASREQSAGIEQVNRAISKMDEMTRQNAALVKQASAAAESMQGHAIKVSQAVDALTRNDTQTTSLPQGRSIRPRQDPRPPLGTRPRQIAE